jgi:hypothetical protein
MPCVYRCCNAHHNCVTSLNVGRRVPLPGHERENKRRANGGRRENTEDMSISVQVVNESAL